MYYDGVGSCLRLTRVPKQHTVFKQDPRRVLVVPCSGVPGQKAHVALAWQRQGHRLSERTTLQADAGAGLLFKVLKSQD